jgi:hypothetical protein
MRIHIDPPPRSRYRRMIRRILVQSNPHKTPQRQRVRQPPRDSPLAVDPLKVASSRIGNRFPALTTSPVRALIKLRAPTLHKWVEPFALQQLVQFLIKRMSRRRCQLGMCDPQILLPCPLLTRSHCHARVVQTLTADSLLFSAPRI